MAMLPGCAKSRNRKGEEETKKQRSGKWRRSGLSEDCFGLHRYNGHLNPTVEVNDSMISMDMTSLHSDD